MAVLGLLPEAFWSLTWADYDDLVFHYHYQAQRDLLGHREIATRIYNSLGAFSKTFQPLSPAKYWPLPLLDPAPPPPPPDSWWQKMKMLAERSGKKFNI